MPAWIRWHPSKTSPNLCPNAQALAAELNHLMLRLPTACAIELKQIIRPWVNAEGKIRALPHFVASQNQS